MSKTRPKWRCVFVDKILPGTGGLGVTVKVSRSSSFLESRVRFELSRGREEEALELHTIEYTYGDLVESTAQYSADALAGFIFLDPRYADSGEEWSSRPLNWGELYHHREQVSRLLLRAIRAIPLLPE